jgi:type IX secretion system PorP/SprF family membrane protein
MYNLREKLACCLLLIGVLANAQDPHFTQFNAAPFSVNPAYAGVFNGTARIMSTYRQQWTNLVDPFITTTMAADFKLGAYDEDPFQQHPFNVGIQLMQDKSMAGAFRSNYVGLNGSYHVKLDEADNQSFGLGMSINYGSRRVDFADISFDEQFTSGGFNLSLPNGEAALQNMKPFLSIGAGALFKVNNPLTGTYFDVGFAAYHLNRPTQTVMSDPNQLVPLRLSGQMGFQTYLDETSVINLRAFYQNQAEVSYLQAGASLAKLFGHNNEDMVGAGIWYRTGDSFAPQVFIEISNLQVGLSYDIAHNNLKRSLTAASSFEMSLQWRFGVPQR